MKIKFDIECTPQEARAFMGLPDVAPMQEKMMEEIENKMQENIRNLDPESFMKTWLPLTIQGWSDIQKGFWNQMQQAGSAPFGSSSDDDDEKKDD